MSLSGTTRKAKAPPKATIRQANLVAQLDSEWEADPARMEKPLACYFHACVRPALNWVNGDPYTYHFPTAYQDQKLAKMCGWLILLREQGLEAQEQAREAIAQRLAHCWPAFASLTYPDMPANWPGSVTDWEIPPFSFESLPGLWDGEDDAALPAFRYPETEEFYICALALLFLNLACKRRLADLSINKDVN